MLKRLALGCLLILLPALATAATVSTIAVASGTVTVTTAAAHGFVVNQGVCASLTPVCAVLATVPTSTTFTFPQPSNVTVGACASSCGTVIAAPRIVVLDVGSPSQAQQSVHYLLWLTTGTPIPNAKTSAWKAGAGSVGVSAAQNNALSAGSFLEIEVTQIFPASQTTGQIQTFLQNDYTTRQSALAANTQPGTYYGSVWDGTAWGVQ